MVTKLGSKFFLADSCLLKRTDDTGMLIICVYVDNMLCIGERKAINLIKTELLKYFSVKDKGKMEKYVGCSVVQDATSNVILHQPHLIKKINLKFGDKLKNMRTPLTPATQ